jgi:hypothetical protein
MNRSEDSIYPLDISRYPSNVYVGISGPYSTRERMVEEAILAAAKSIHLKAALAMNSRLITSEHSDRGLRIWATEEKAYWNDTALAATIEVLQVIDITFDQQAGAIVVVQNPMEKPTERIYRTTWDRQGRPTWLKSWPAVDGYRFAVGATNQYYYLNTTLEAADFAGAQLLLDLKSDHVFSVENVSTYNELMERVLYQAQMGVLKGFTVIDRYYDEQARIYYSLVACFE